MRGNVKQTPSRARLARLATGATLEAAVSSLDAICRDLGRDGCGLSRGELSKAERSKRWLKPWQLKAWAIYLKVTPGLLCEWLLEHRSLVNADS